MNREQGARGASARIRERLSYANVMATVAVFGVLAGGGAYAASKIGPKDIAKNAVRSKHIKNGQVRAADLARQERFHVVGTPGEPQFFDGGEGDCVWTNDPSSGFAPASFQKDALGRVHLRGQAFGSDGPGGDGDCDPNEAGEAEDGVVFILPPRYRPKYVTISTSVAQIAVVPPQGAVFANGPVPPGAVFSALTSTAGFDDAEFTAASPAAALRAKAPVKLSLRDLSRVAGTQ